MDGETGVAQRGGDGRGDGGKNGRRDGSAGRGGSGCHRGRSRGGGAPAIERDKNFPDECDQQGERAEGENDDDQAGDLELQIVRKRRVIGQGNGEQRGDGDHAQDILTNTRPSSTASPGWTRISFTVPAAGAKT